MLVEFLEFDLFGVELKVLYLIVWMILFVVVMVVGVVMVLLMWLNGEFIDIVWFWVCLFGLFVLMWCVMFGLWLYYYD